MRESCGNEVKSIKVLRCQVINNGCIHNSGRGRPVWAGAAGGASAGGGGSGVLGGM